MSKISTAYDTVLSILDTLYPTKTILFNPYSLSDNPNHIIKDGYGIRKVDTSGITSEMCNYTDSHGFEFVLTREIVRLEPQTEKLDATVKAMLEDMVSFRQRFFNPNLLGIAGTVQDVTLGTASAIDTFIAGKNKFISMSIGFTLQINENFI